MEEIESCETASVTNDLCEIAAYVIAALFTFLLVALEVWNIYEISYYNHRLNENATDG